MIALPLQWSQRRDREILIIIAESKTNEPGLLVSRSILLLLILLLFNRMMLLCSPLWSFWWSSAAASNASGVSNSSELGKCAENVNTALGCIVTTARVATSKHCTIFEAIFTSSCCAVWLSLNTHSSRLFGAALIIYLLHWRNSDIINFTILLHLW